MVVGSVLGQDTSSDQVVTTWMSVTVCGQVNHLRI